MDFLNSLSLSLSHSLSFTIRLNQLSLRGSLQGDIQCPYRAVEDKFEFIVQHFHVLVKGPLEHRLYVRPYFSSSVPHVLSVLLFLEMGYHWPYSCCFVGGCFQDLFTITRSILVKLPSGVFPIRLVSVHEVDPYSKTDMPTDSHTNSKSPNEKIYNSPQYTEYLDSMSKRKYLIVEKN